MVYRWPGWRLRGFSDHEPVEGTAWLLRASESADPNAAAQAEAELDLLRPSLDPAGLETARVRAEELRGLYPESR